MRKLSSKSQNIQPTIVFLSKVHFLVFESIQPSYNLYFVASNLKQIPEDWEISIRFKWLSLQEIMRINVGYFLAAILKYGLQKSNTPSVEAINRPEKNLTIA